MKSGEELQGSIESQSEREVILTPAEGGERLTISRGDIRHIEADDSINENNRAGNSRTCGARGACY